MRGLALTDSLRPALGTEAFLVTDGTATFWKVAAELKIQHDDFVSGHNCKGVSTGCARPSCRPCGNYHCP